MRKLMIGMLGLMVSAWALTAHGATAWVEGKHYFLVQPAQRTNVPAGKVEVAEAFSYGCPACNQFLPVIEDLKSSLPSNAQVVYVPASFNPSEQWPLFQRAYLTAQAMGIAERTHGAMFKAIWTTGELAVIDQRTGRIKKPPPTLDDVAQFYARTAGVEAKQFIATANSFSINLGMKRSDDWIKSSRVDQTPTIVVNGKYRLHAGTAGGIREMIELVNWLVAKENAAKP